MPVWTDLDVCLIDLFDEACRSLYDPLLKCTHSPYYAVRISDHAPSIGYCSSI